MSDAPANSSAVVMPEARRSAGGFGDYVDRTQIHKELPRRLLDLLLVVRLSEQAPLTTAILMLLNIIESKHFPEDAPNFQLEHVRAIAP